MKMIQ